jgi:hypothetical protein
MFAVKLKVMPEPVQPLVVREVSEATVLPSGGGVLFQVPLLNTVAAELPEVQLAVMPAVTSWKVMLLEVAVTGPEFVAVHVPEAAKAGVLKTRAMAPAPMAVMANLRME